MARKKSPTKSPPTNAETNPNNPQKQSYTHALKNNFPGLPNIPHEYPQLWREMLAEQGTFLEVSAQKKELEDRVLEKLYEMLVNINLQYPNPPREVQPNAVEATTEASEAAGKGDSEEVHFVFGELKNRSEVHDYLEKLIEFGNCRIKGLNSYINKILDRYKSPFLLVKIDTLNQMINKVNEEIDKYNGPFGNENSLPKLVGVTKLELPSWPPRGVIWS